MDITVRMVSRHLSRALSYCEIRVRYASAEQMRALLRADEQRPGAAENTR